MADETNTPTEFPADKFGDWIPVDEETHVMVLELLADDGEYVTHAACVMQVETKSGSVGLCNVQVPIDLVMHWIEDEDNWTEDSANETD